MICLWINFTEQQIPEQLLMYEFVIQLTAGMTAATWHPPSDSSSQTVARCANWPPLADKVGFMRKKKSR